MNTTSSRSHTILTLEIDQRPHEMLAEDNEAYHTNENNNASDGKIMRSKLLLIDLAGSERVRRTTSTGRRLEEAKSINVSLSALGNVVAALADPYQRSNHVPYRDSKLTKLTADVLAGKSNAALIATVGPAVPNISETLSTLLFASRCMDVELKHVETNEVVDYPALCMQLQLRLNQIQRVTQDRETRKKQQYEHLIRTMATKIQTLENSDLENGHSNTESNTENNNSNWLETNMSNSSSISSSGPSLKLIKRSYLALTSTLTVLSILLVERAQWEILREAKRTSQIEIEKVKEDLQNQEYLRMQNQDPIHNRKKKNDSVHSIHSIHSVDELEGRVSKSKALEKAYALTNPMEDVHVGPVLERFEQDVKEYGTKTREKWQKHYDSQHESFEELFKTENGLQHSMKELQQNIVLYADVLAAISRNEHDALYDARSQIANLIVEQQKHEQDVINWSKILQHLNVWNKNNNSKETRNNQKNSVDGSSGGNTERKEKEKNATDWSAREEEISLSTSHTMQETITTNNVPGSLPMEKDENRKDDVTSSEGQDALHLWIQQQERVAEKEEQLASEEEKSLYQRQIEAKEQLLQLQNKQLLQQQEEHKKRKRQQQQQQQQQHQISVSTRPTGTTSATGATTTTRKEEGYRIGNEMHSSNSNSNSNSLPESRTFLVQIQKTAKRSEEGLGLIFGQRLKPEDINFESNILNQMYIIFVRTVIKNGNASQTQIQRKQVLVSIDNEDVMGRTIDYIHTMIDMVEVGTVITLEFFETGTNMTQPVYAPRVEFYDEPETSGDDDAHDKDEDEDDGDGGGDDEDDDGIEEMKIEKKKAPQSPGLFLLGSPQYSQLQETKRENLRKKKQIVSPPPVDSQFHGTQQVTSPEYSQFQTSSTKPPPPPPSSLEGNQSLLNAFHTQAEKHLQKKSQNNFKKTKPVLQERENENENENENSLVTPYTRSILTWPHIRAGDMGGWLMRKRKDLNGKWEAQYLMMENDTSSLSSSLFSSLPSSASSSVMKTYRLLTLKGTVSLVNATIHALDTAVERSKYVSETETQRYPHLLAIVTPALPKPLVLSAPTKGQHDRWVHALRWVIQSYTSKRDRTHSSSSRRSRRKSITEMALKQVLEEGLLVKKAVSTSIDLFRNWNQRFFKLHADTMELEYFDVKQHDEWKCEHHQSRSTTMSVHREAVEDGINPIWFQKQCRFTFKCSLIDVTSEPDSKKEEDEDAAEMEKSRIDLGTFGDDVRRVWMAAMDDSVDFDELDVDEEEEATGNRVPPSALHQRIGSSEEMFVSGVARA